MLKYKNFLGKNNVLPPERLTAQKTGTPLAEALNCDVNNDAQLIRRVGYTQISSVCHKNVWEGDDFILATRDGGDLISIINGVEHLLYSSLGSTRVWYTQMPDGRVRFSNGQIHGIVMADGLSVTGFGIPIPATLGDYTDVAGQLFPGSYQWQLTYVRTVDGLEGGAAYSSQPVPINDGGIFLANLPQIAGHTINVYLTSHNAGDAFLAGNTATSIFTFTGQDKDLVLPCKTDWLMPPPVGTISAMWRGRMLVAKDNVLYASRPGQWELFDQRKDFKVVPDPITLVMAVDEGLFVGTERELAYLSGDKFDELVYTQTVRGRVVLGSGVRVLGEWIARGDSVGQGTAMVCIADGYITAGFSDGHAVPMTAGRYRASLSEVAATFRVRDGIPQYIAIAQ